MRIGQVAALLGISTRTIRHYHQIGVLPEPDREPNGYRHYSLRDLVVLARARRLAEVGLSLESVAEVMADERGADVLELLDDLDRDLEQQQRRLDEARIRLAEFRDRLARRQPVLGSPEMSGFFDGIAERTYSPSLEVDRALLSLVPQAALSEMAGLLTGADGAVLGADEATELYAEMDALADAAADDPRAATLAARIVAAIPSESRAELRRLTAEGTGPALAAMEAALSEVQFAVVRHVLGLLSEER